MRSADLSQQPLDLRQLPGAEQADRVGAETLSRVESPHTTVQASALQAVVQVLTVKVEQQLPAVDFDRDLAWPGCLGNTL